MLAAPSQCVTNIVVCRVELSTKLRTSVSQLGNILRATIDEVMSSEIHNFVAVGAGVTMLIDTLNHIWNVQQITQVEIDSKTTVSSLQISVSWINLKHLAAVSS